MRLINTVAQLKALAHEGRLRLFRLLVKAGPDGMAAGDLAAAARENFTTTSAQLLVLSNAGLANGRRDGRSIIYSADYKAISKLMGFLMKDCCQGRADILAPLANITAEAVCCESKKEARR